MWGKNKDQFPFMKEKMKCQYSQRVENSGSTNTVNSISPIYLAEAQKQKKNKTSKFNK